MEPRRLQSDWLREPKIQQNGCCSTAGTLRQFRQKN